MFQRVAAPSQAGQYSVNFATGVYTFASADATAPVLISYTYNVTGTGYKVAITNQLLGTTPTFKMTFYQMISPGSTGIRTTSAPSTASSPPPADTATATSTS